MFLIHKQLFIKMKFNQCFLVAVQITSHDCFLPDNSSLLYTVPWHSPSPQFCVGSWSLQTLSWNGGLSYFLHLSFYKMLCLFLEDLIFKRRHDSNVLNSGLSHCNIVNSAKIYYNVLCYFFKKKKIIKTQSKLKRKFPLWNNLLHCISQNLQK